MLAPAIAALLVSQLSPHSIDTAAQPARWQASLQAGAGRMDADAAAMLLPRLGYTAQAERASLVLAAPIYVRAGDGWLADWSRPETYAGFVERLRLSAGGLELSAGALAQQTLGYGLVVDHYNAGLDPARPRSGARLDLVRPTLSASLMTDGVIRPHLVAASVHGAPLAWLRLDPEARLRVGLDGAVDLRAPSAGGGHAPVGAASAMLGFVLWRGANVALESYAGAAYLSHPGWGAHGGLSLEVADGSGDDALVLRFEGVARGSGYTPGYFDAVYEAERWSVGDAGPKSAVRPAAGAAARVAAAARLGGASFGLTATTGEDGEMGGDLYARVELDKVSVALMLVQRGLGRDTDAVLRAGDRTYALLEAAVALTDGLFAFSTLHHGWRRPAGGGVEVVTDWLAGIGWSAGAVL